MEWRPVHGSRTEGTELVLRRMLGCFFVSVCNAFKNREDSFITQQTLQWIKHSSAHFVACMIKMKSNTDLSESQEKLKTSPLNVLTSPGPGRRWLLGLSRRLFELPVPLPQFAHSHAQSFAWPHPCPRISLNVFYLPLNLKSCSQAFVERSC